MKKPLIGGKDLHKLPLDKENKLKEGSWKAFGFYFKILSCVFERGKNDLGRRGE
jgi:hypothetical protein